MQEERDRVHQCLDESTLPKLISVLETELIKNHLQALVGHETTGAAAMMRHERIEDLHRMYKLTSYVPGGSKELMACVTNVIRVAGQTIVKAEEVKQPSVNALKFVQSFLDLKRTHDRFLKEAFESDIDFRSAINSAFASAINESQRAPEYISIFIDDKMKRGAKEVAFFFPRSLRLSRYAVRVPGLVVFVSVSLFFSYLNAFS